jgi:tRNA (adenine22-N1)-methyltransferase
MIRLQALAYMIPPYTRIADIGCDHGYLIDLAFKQGLQYAQAIDNKPLPLKKAKDNLSIYQDKVTYSLSSGLNQLLPSIPCIVLAGLGGRLIVDLLNKDLDKLTNVERIITEPHKNIDQVRKFLSTHGYQIASEQVIEEESIFYEIIVFEKGLAHYTDTELLFGPLLMRHKDPLWIKKWQKIDEELSHNPHPMTNKKRELIHKHVPLGENQ